MQPNWKGQERKRGRIKKSTTIYLEEELMVAAKKKCFMEGITFTSYIGKLIRKDFEGGKDV